MKLFKMNLQLHAVKKATEIATIDVVLVTVKSEEVGADEYLLNTANQIQVEPLVETQDAVPLIIKGVLKAQKPEEETIRGNTITLTDNVFTPELVKLLQGGTIKYDATEATKVVGYTPPNIGQKQTLPRFILTAYSACYNEAGEITQYEKCTYTKCKGKPIGFGGEDGVFRANEYTIISMPEAGTPPFDIDYVAALPVVA